MYKENVVDLDLDKCWLSLNKVRKDLTEAKERLNKTINIFTEQIHKEKDLLA